MRFLVVVQDFSSQCVARRGVFATIEPLVIFAVDIT